MEAIHSQYGNFSSWQKSLKSGFVAFLSGNSGPWLGFHSPLPPDSRHAPRKGTLGPLAGVALSIMTECWLGSELQISGPKTDKTSSPCLLRTVMLSCLSLWYRTHHPKYSGLMSTYVLKTESFPWGEGLCPLSVSSGPSSKADPEWHLSK